MQPAKYDRKITFERGVASAPNALNEVDLNWVAFGQVWARRSDVRDAERVAAGRAISEAMARFTVRNSALVRSVTSQDRIVSNGEVWRIDGLKQVGDRAGDDIEITATRVVGDV